MVYSLAPDPPKDFFIIEKDRDSSRSSGIMMRLHEIPIQDASLGVQKNSLVVAKPLLGIAELEERK